MWPPLPRQAKGFEPEFCVEIYAALTFNESVDSWWMQNNTPSGPVINANESGWGTGDSPRRADKHLVFRPGS